MASGLWLTLLACSTITPAGILGRACRRWTVECGYVQDAWLRRALIRFFSIAFPILVIRQGAMPILTVTLVATCFR